MDDLVDFVKRRNEQIAEERTAQFHATLSKVAVKAHVRRMDRDTRFRLALEVVQAALGPGWSIFRTPGRGTGHDGA
jgi:hypothetical protein